MLKELTQMIRENEFLLSRKHIFKNSKYIVIIEPERVKQEGSSWEGNMGKLKSFIEEESGKHVKDINKLTKQTRVIMHDEIEASMRVVKQTMMQQINELEQDVNEIIENVDSMQKVKRSYF